MGTKVSAAGPGTIVKVRYLGGAEEPQEFIGAATRNEYYFGGKINLGEVDSRDLVTGASYAPGLFELTGPKGEKLFTVHIPRQRKTKAEKEEPEPEEQEPDGESPVPGD
jgi:hypothetical protein